MGGVDGFGDLAIGLAALGLNDQRDWLYKNTSEKIKRKGCKDFENELF